MKRKYLKIVLLAILLLTAGAPAYAELPREITVCGDQNEWPPFTYFLREKGRKSETITGFNVDFLNGILAGSGRKAKFSLLPWSRCLALAARGEIDIALDGIKSPGRERDFVFPESHYFLSSGYIYSKARPAPKVTSASDFLNLNICAQNGYNYEGYGLPPGIKLNHANSYEAAVKMLLAGRCDVMFLNVELLSGFRLLGEHDVWRDEQIAVAPLPWMEPFRFFMMVGRGSPRRDELLDLLNRGIAHMKKSGAMARLERHYRLR